MKLQLNKRINAQNLKQFYLQLKLFSQICEFRKITFYDLAQLELPEALINQGHYVSKSDFLDRAANKSNIQNSQFHQQFNIMKKQTQKRISKTTSLHSEDEMKLNKTLFIDCRTDNIYDSYEINRVLGEGGFGIVYEATCKNNRHCKRAIKSIQKKKLKKLRALENEIKILTKMDHPLIIKIYETFEDQSYIHIVMDICEGGELFYYLCENSNISEKIIRILFMQMAQAIQYCHHKKIAHRDLKPENFLILSNTTQFENIKLKLIDFGFAYEWKENMKDQISQKVRTQTVGTPYYVAPEVLEEKNGYDEQCDIWSLGVILYIMMTASPPFSGNNDVQILKAVKKGKYSLDTSEIKRFSFTLKDLLVRLLQPVQKRIKLIEIFQHPWMQSEKVSSHMMKVNFGKMYNFTKYNKLKRIVVTYIASQMSQKQIINLSQLFQNIDTNRDGELTVQEFEKCLSQQKHNISLKQINNLITGIDLDKDGKINYTQFVSCSLENLKIFNQQNMINAFRMLDRDRNGKVSVQQLRYLLDRNHELNQAIKEEQLEKIIKISDINHDGVLDFQEFQKALTSRN